MGDSVGSRHYTDEDYIRFSRLLRQETALLARWMSDGVLDPSGSVTGLELETWLVGDHGLPVPDSQKFLDRLNDSTVGPELSRFNIELNSLPCALTGDVLTFFEKQLKQKWSECRRCAEHFGDRMIMIGTLPTLKPEMLNLETMSPFDRYRALNETIFRLRGGKSVRLDVLGNEHLQLSHKDVMLESAATSLQIHIQVPPEKAHRYYNASLLASGPMVALSANSPFLFGKDLWAETRIPLFEQSVAVGHFKDMNGQQIKRVTFGSEYARDSVLECFLENLDSYPILLPEIYHESAEKMKHLSLHNGTIWRWNRPLVGVSEDGTPHLRIEHRVPAAGPSVDDVVANMAFFLGLVVDFVHSEEPLENKIPFEVSRRNFYKAAKYGLSGYVIWEDGRQVEEKELILYELLSRSQRGLRQLGVSSKDADRYLYGIIENRVRSEQNGANWQRRFIQKHGDDFPKMIQAYIENQDHDIPVHEWKI